MSTQQNEPDALKVLAAAFDDFFAAMAVALKPVAEAFAQLGESITTVAGFTLAHVTELADKMHEDAGKPYGDAPDAGLRWLHDQLQERSK